MSSDGTFIRLACPGCGVSLNARRQYVGYRIGCPRCGEEVLVPQRSETPDDDPRLYAAGQRATWQSQQPRYVPVVCGTCGTRMHAAVEEIGHELFCPDCGRGTVVPPPQPQRRKRTPWVEDDGDQWTLGAAAAPPPLELFAPLRQTNEDENNHEDGDDAGADGALGLFHDRTLYSVRRLPPRHPFLTGIVTFPLYPGCWPRWLVLSLWLATAYGLWMHAATSVPFAMMMGLAGMPAMLLALLATFAGGVALIVWIIFASVQLLAIARETSAAADRIEQWPEPPWLDWVADSLYVINSLVVAALPVSIVSWAAGAAGERVVLSLAAAGVLLWPVVMLSMLEAGSRCALLTATVVRSIAAAPWAWVLFYVQTTAVTAVVVWAWRWAGWALGFASMTAFSMLLVAALFIYFRLLGRLVLCSSAALAKRTESQEDDEHDDGTPQPAGSAADWT